MLSQSAAASVVEPGLLGEQLTPVSWSYSNVP
jgi:hypothetical protein